MYRSSNSIPASFSSLRFFKIPQMYRRRNHPSFPSLVRRGLRGGLSGRCACGPWWRRRRENKSAYGLTWGIPYWSTPLGLEELAWPCSPQVEIRRLTDYSREAPSGPADFWPLQDRRPAARVVKGEAKQVASLRVRPREILLGWDYTDSPQL